MYFQIENTPEHIKRARRVEKVTKESPKEECPRLILAPFSRPPQVVFDNVLVGSSCERDLEVYNPSKQLQQITLGKALPPGLVIHLPGEWIELEPETCYVLTMRWTPLQPTAMRETIRFTNENRGRYDVIVVLKSTVTIKGKNNQPKGFKTSPGKKKKNVVSKKSPVAIYKKKAEIIYKATTKVQKTVNVVQSTEHKVYETYNKEYNRNDYSIDYNRDRCPFDSPTSLDLNFNTSEIFSNMRKENNVHLDIPHNVLRPSTKQTVDANATDIFDNLTFTPLKSLPNKVDKLEKGPRIIVSVNSDSDFDDSLDMKTSNKENVTNSIISITSSVQTKRTVEHMHVENALETPVQNKKLPNTSSPKEFNSPNFTINTDFSRISDLSFHPSRFSTERKCFPKINETHEILEDKLSSDTYTKDSPHEPYQMSMERPPHFFNKEQPKMCRQSLFREYQMQREAYDRNYLNAYDHNVWQNDLRGDIKSPTRSVTPPLQSIPEESAQFSETQVLDKTDKHTATFTVDRTFDRPLGKSSLSTSTLQTWSKKAVRVEPDLWKVPVVEAKKSLKPKPLAKPKASIGSKVSNVTLESNKSINQNVTVNLIGNIYTQSSTVDPFSSATYFYDEEAVHKFENEFKRWLNCILTPPADLDSNEDLKIDVGKAWIENRNKEVPLAPTKEQVSSAYHNSHRLESLRRSARNLLMSAEMVQIFQKLNAQIEKKLITIRTDRNLHLDIGLQKIIMEILLSYNPLWLRIGLEAIYGLVLPLKSNSDIEGLTTFIIQRMFKNPFLKNKHSKSSAPNMLLPAYMEAIKKFTLKKFFMLVLFLDQAKQRKLISHDPCLFCRNALCKESREIIIRFTRELIAGIGDITRHLRPLGYVVCHKQSYLDEYKFAVHNLALDIRDGVRLTKVMEIIMMKNGLMTQLRTPAISRLQKIHNVQVAMNALKEANFVIDGDITATDIADGHREKTLSLLWQLIHVFRAPLFEKAANVIQTWWRKKYEVIVAIRKEEESKRLRLTNAASIIQYWWRKIQYNRQVEYRMQQVTTATVVIQKYCRMWLCRTRLRRFKWSVVKIEEWYKSVRLMREAKRTVKRLKTEREQLRHRSATVIQADVRRWLCVRHYTLKVQRIVKIQSIVRKFLIRKHYTELKKSVTYVQQKYRSKLLMRLEMQKLAEQRESAIIIQSYWRMMKHRTEFLNIKRSIQILKDRYIALIKMRKERNDYLTLKRSVIAMQALYRSKRCRVQYLKLKNAIILLQRRARANQQMKKDKARFLVTKNAAILLQTYFRSYLTMIKIRESYNAQKRSAILIQRYFRSYQLVQSQRQVYIKLRKASIVLQKHYRSLRLMRRDRHAYFELRKAVICIQRHYRAKIEMRKCKESYMKLQTATVTLQRRYRALIKMREQRSHYVHLRSCCTTIQTVYRAYVLGKQQRENFINQKEAAIKIQNWLRNIKKSIATKQEYELTKKACVTIQQHFKAYIIGREVRHEYIRIKTASICIQKFYRSYIVTKTVRREYIRIKTSTITIQRFYRSYVETKKQRNIYLTMKHAVCCIEYMYKRYKKYQTIRQRYLHLRQATIHIQNRYRAIIEMRVQGKEFIRLKQATVIVQRQFRALIAMRVERNSYLKLRSAIVNVQNRYRAQRLMKQERLKYDTIKNSCILIQKKYRAYVVGTKTRHAYLKLKESTVVVQQRYRALLFMRKEKSLYMAKQRAAIIIQRRYKATKLMLKDKHEYMKVQKACKTIQNAFKAYLAGKRQRANYLKIKTSVILIQTRWRMLFEMRKERTKYLRLRNTVIQIQRRFRANQILLSVRRDQAASKIQIWFRSVQLRIKYREEFLLFRKQVVTAQSVVRMYYLRKKFLAIRKSTTIIQLFYRSYKLSVEQRQRYINYRRCAITLQSYVRSYIVRKNFLRLRAAVCTVQAAYRLKKQRDLIRARRESAAILLQKYIRRYLVQSWYSRYRQTILYIQEIWRGKLLTRLIRCEYLQKRRIVIKIQSVARGYLVRKQVECKKEHIIKIREEKRQHWAASKIQALFRGHKVRSQSKDAQVTELRRRWREGALHSTEETLKERNADAMDVLRNMSDIETVIMAFKSLKLLTEVFPMMYAQNAAGVVRRVQVYMSTMNRSVPSVEVLRSAAAILVNLARYRLTGPKIYNRELIPPILKFMWRFSNSESLLFCKLCTYLWLYSKYDGIREDLTELLQEPENHKMIATIKTNVERTKRMATNARNAFYTPKPNRSISHNNSCFNSSICSSVSHSNTSIVMPSVEPDYGIVRIDKPRYFEDPGQAINCLINTYNL